MEVLIRKTRTLRPTEIKLGDDEIEQLSQLYADPRYEALLNVMERACISLDTAHLDTPTSDPETVLGGHCVCKAAWFFYTYVQRQILAAYHMRTGAQPPEEKPNLDDLLQGVGGIPDMESDQ